ncbi:ribonuclease H-like domain-containing protein [Evansella tamaricis]|uniref:Ribonuclease H-like domain-containing protein n=1 Tax=Evansella tamaricis TaxID=2069301 RepID=A0ABS6JMD8_9BACI|nr:ribonuclease H-like domain-containing protein [Evansella tamaricis]MBU9714844.1 ribonuclease H-like domain-containing protein [Evansella tamaricis]
MSIKSKLQRMKTHLKAEDTHDGLVEKLEDSPPVLVFADSDRELAEKWKKHGFDPFSFGDQISYRKRSFYPWKNSAEKRDIETTYKLWDEYSHEHPLSCKDVPLHRMLFFDTETTGLSTGAGNTIFLIGYARVLKEGIEVIQHLLGDPSSEGAFLYGFLQDFHEEDYLVSYNGKAFDWPQVRSRHTFVRDQVPRLPAFGHIDLLHAARRLWKHELPSCRLSIVEKEKLGIFRSNDTPGSMAPILYYEYLQEEDPEHLLGIIEHNNQDVRSLISLFVAISNRIFFQSQSPFSQMEHIQIGNWLEQTGNLEGAKGHYITASNYDDKDSGDAFYRLGLLLKKMGDVADAKKSFTKCVQISPFCHIDAYIELAKLAEHQEKDYLLAHAYARKAKQGLKGSQRLTKKQTDLLSAVKKRVERLEKKLG